MLVENLPRAMEPQINEGDEFIVSFTDHEANVGSWSRLTTIHIMWSSAASLDDLKDPIISQTLIVAFTACSNILGAWTRPKEVATLVRRVARQKDTKKSQAFFRQLSHFPIALFSQVYLKLQLGGPGYEVTYGTTGVPPYLPSLAGNVGVGDRSESELLNEAFRRIAAHEENLMKPIIGFLLSEEVKKAGVRIVGPESADEEVRAPTISFVVVGQDGKTKRLQSTDVVAESDYRGGL
ncbi:hypothetical protein FRC00_004940, partial [Tulasnella sp. 408]